MDDERKELQALLERVDALAAELRVLDELHRGDSETIARLERQLSDQHQAAFERGLAESNRDRPVRKSPKR